MNINYQSILLKTLITAVVVKISGFVLSVIFFKQFINEWGSRNSNEFPLYFYSPGIVNFIGVVSGCERVRTYIQSGNIAFDAPKRSVAEIIRRLQTQSYTWPFYLENRFVNRDSLWCRRKNVWKLFN